jgi:hypothetical protein
VRFPCVHAVATTPAQRLGHCIAHSPQPCQPSPVWQPGRPAHRPFRGLLGVHSRYGLHTRAVTVCRDTLNRRLQPFRCLHSCSGCFRLERIAGWALHPLESAALSRRTPEADVSLSAQRRTLAVSSQVCERRAASGRCPVRSMSTSARLKPIAFSILAHFLCQSARMRLVSTRYAHGLK